jgi:transcriptional regulator with XRE-family HTH domain
MGNDPLTDPAILRARTAFEDADISLEELGKRMGYPAAIARKSAWQFLNKTADPRISMLRKFAKALGISLGRLVGPKD